MASAVQPIQDKRCIQFESPSPIDFSKKENRTYNWDKIQIDHQLDVPVGMTPFIKKVNSCMGIIKVRIPLKISKGFYSEEQRSHHEAEVRALYQHFGLQPPK